MYSEQEKKELTKKYRDLLRVWKRPDGKKGTSMVRKAFKLAVEAHSDMRRLSGDPYVYHPVEVAYICAKDMRLGSTSIVCALLHDVVEDTEYTLEEIEKLFSPKVAMIVGGVTKIKGIFDDGTRSIQAEYFKRMILALAEDMRVILIKLADRLHNMRTLEHMSRTKQLKIASETLVLYAPLAHRMGLYNVKTELEDLSLKYTEPEIYEHIKLQVEKTEKGREKFINRFVNPINSILDKHEIPNKVHIRVKSVYSIWQKMQKKNIPFEDVYDIFAVRIIIDSKFENEKMDCWMVYSMITDVYKPKHDRVRDWLSIPKANGYEALHLTVMSNEGRWVEVQVRTKRMHEIAESGFASHHHYKNLPDEGKDIENWLSRIREQFENPDSDALSFLDNFKLDLYSEEIYTFTPKGDMKKLPVDATVLDFAYNIHSEIGNQSIGAKVNLSLVPLNQVLKNGDQVEIITSKIQKPQENWLDYVVTARAKSYVKNAIRNEKKKFYKKGKEKLKLLFKEINMEFTKANNRQLKEYTKLNSSTDLYYEVSQGNVGLQELKHCCLKSGKSSWYNSLIPFSRQKNSTDKSLAQTIGEKIRNKPEEVLLGEKVDIEYKIAECCNPIPGDDVIGLIMPDNPIMVHRANCKNAVDMMSSFGNRIVKAKWNKKDPVLFLAGIEFRGIDKIGFIYQITDIISQKHKLKIRSFHLDSSNEILRGKIMLYVQDTKKLSKLIADLKKLKEIKQVSRMNPA
ncbi:MAG: RelA/SpoT family protein [Bacteroidetes bacterium 4484_276]|nr:MAG: RelA/SpoT family protein [Bacteroidetes bacterium 4484_276]